MLWWYCLSWEVYGTAIRGDSNYLTHFSNPITMSRKTKLDGLPIIRKRVEVVEAKIQVLKVRIEEWELAEVDQVAVQSKEGVPPHATSQSLSMGGDQDLFEARLQHCMHAFETKLLAYEARISALEADKKEYEVRISTLEGEKTRFEARAIAWEQSLLGFPELVSKVQDVEGEVSVYKDFVA